VSERYLDETHIVSKRCSSRSMFGLCMVNRRCCLVFGETLECFHCSFWLSCFFSVWFVER